jgi:hypothetical protein
MQILAFLSACIGVYQRSISKLRRNRPNQYPHRRFRYTGFSNSPAQAMPDNQVIKK